MYLGKRLEIIFRWSKINSSSDAVRKCVKYLY